MKTSLKTFEEINLMARGGALLSNVLKELSVLIEPGINLFEIEKKADKLIKETGGKPNFKNYEGFPSAVCISLNEEIVHGIPRNRELKQGDIVSLDMGIFFNPEQFLGEDFDRKKYPNLKEGFHTDMARTFAVGEVDSEAKRLIMVTKKSLKRGIKKVRPGITLGDLGNTIQRYAEKQGFGVVRDLCGHGIGRDLHEDPQVLNYGQRHKGEKLVPGMVLCIEPMLTMGDFNIKMGRDGFSILTKDNSLSAHFEDMIAVTEDGCRILS